ncbi:vascular endothelial growth factor A-like [Odontomachus brunneus]|uniref:vascular endothelial growth factor A-like n=1 Tax=Odontomachus brunneus TaxID=486640 RepID=UPI0013F224C4|nr:vascular endothelial growth factor A-like [Odontomachus brunneus]
MQPQRFRTTFGRQLLCLFVKMLLFGILCGFVVVSISAQYHGVPDDIVFPGPVSSKPRNKPATSYVLGNEAQIPVELASRLNSINTTEEFLQLLQDIPANEKKLTFTSRIGEGEERSNALKPLSAKCMPELQTVSLKLNDDPGTIVYPSCTRINRCGGCCSSSLLSCQPTASETRNFEVIVTTLSLHYRYQQIVPLEEHTACKCGCRIKEEHCNEKQHYEQKNCICVCDNVDEETKCIRNNETKMWDPDLCVCSCRRTTPCNTGYYFDHNTCRCRQITFSRPVNRFSPTKSSNYNFDNTQQPQNVPPVIIPLDATDPRRRHKEDPEYE